MCSRRSHKSEVLRYCVVIVAPVEGGGWGGRGGGGGGVFFFQAEDGIRDLVRSRGLGDVYKRQPGARAAASSRIASRWSPSAVRAASGKTASHGRRSGLSLIHI